MTSNQNFSGQSTPDIVDTVYYRCNFAQPEPVRTRTGEVVGVRLFPGDNTPRTFISCNLANCQVPPGSEVQNCNTSLSEQRQPDATEEVVVDGRTVIRVTKFKDVYHGRYLSDGAIQRPE